MSQKHNCLTDKSFKIDFRNNKSGKTNRFQFFRIDLPEFECSRTFQRNKHNGRINLIKKKKFLWRRIIGNVRCWFKKNIGWYVKGRMKL
jgi:hypothetical protein